MKQRTFCPYCGTANLVDKQIVFSEGGMVVFQCHFCKNIFTDLSIQENDKEQDFLANDLKQE